MWMLSWSTELVHLRSLYFSILGHGSLSQEGVTTNCDSNLVALDPFQPSSASSASSQQSWWTKFSKKKKSAQILAGEGYIHSGKLTYFLFEMVIFHCYVSLPEGNSEKIQEGWGRLYIDLRSPKPMSRADSKPEGYQGHPFRRSSGLPNKRRSHDGDGIPRRKLRPKNWRIYAI